MENNKPNLNKAPKNLGSKEERIVEIDSLIEQLKIEKKQQKNTTDREKKEEEIMELKKEKEGLLNESLEDIAYKSVHSLLSEKEQEFFDKNKEEINKIIVEEKENSNKKAEDLTNEIKSQIETEDTKKEYEKLPEEEKQKIEIGLSTLGFVVEQKKNNLFAGAFDKMLKVLPDGTTSRFCKEMRDSFVRDSEKAQKTAEAITSGKEKHRIKNTSLFFGNILKYGRVVTDLTGTSLASPLRYVMMGGMVFTRTSEAAKEARLNNEDVMEKTRITDIDSAEEEAWKIYERAKTKQGAENVSSQSLKDAYMMEMPKDLSERLKEPTTGNGFIQKILRKHLEFSIGHINGSIEKIHNDPKLSPEEKEAKERKIIQKQQQKLRDYDRMLTQYGTVDGLAMAGRYAQLLGKKVVTAVTIETLYLSVEKMYEGLSHLFSGAETQIPIHHHGNTESVVRDATRVDNTKLNLTDHKGIIEKIKVTSLTSEENKILEQINIKDAVVHKGEGIENAFIRQIEHNHKLVQELGFKGNVNDAKALHDFAGRQAHIVAIKEGYVDNFGHEVRVAEADKVAYEIKMENGHIAVQEKTVDGKILETHHEGDKFETKTDKYEYGFKKEDLSDDKGHELSTIESKQIRPLEINENGHIVESKNDVLLSQEDMPYDGKNTALENKDIPTVEQKDSIGSAAVIQKGIPEELWPKEVQNVHEGLNSNNFEDLTELGKELYKDNIHKIFPTEEDLKIWDQVKNSTSLSAEKILNMKVEDIDQKYEVPIQELLKKLQKVTELDPMSASPVTFAPAETLNEYIMRTMIKAGDLGRLDEVKL